MVTVAGRPFSSKYDECEVNIKYYQRMLRAIVSAAAYIQFRRMQARFEASVAGIGKI